MTAGDGFAVPPAPESGRSRPDAVPPAPRPTAVAGTFYPGEPGELATMVDELLDVARSAHPAPARPIPSPAVGAIVPHAGLVYSGIVAAAGWRALLSASASPRPPPTIVLLGTNHGAAWLNGVGAWDRGPWRTPLGDVALDRELTEAIIALGEPFVSDARCHLGEHSLEVQLPFLARLAPGARIVALSVGMGTGRRSVEAGERLGRLLAARRAAGEPVVVAISTDMAHYPAAAIAERVTAALLPNILRLAPEALAEAEADLVRREPGVSCGMCGIEPAVLGLAALRAMGVQPGDALAAATSADAGGDPRRTVGYLAVAFSQG
jgi:AmmeMemoRadiSam system protein B